MAIEGRLIEATRLENWIDGGIHGAEVNGNAPTVNLYDVLAYLDGMPTVDAVEVVHGRWIVKGQDVFCSHCDKESGYNHGGANAFSNYCPNCGAKMDLMVHFLD